MAYTLQALIGAAGTLSSSELKALVVWLDRGYEMIPFTSESLKNNGFESLPLSSENDAVLPENIHSSCIALSVGCKILYVEAEYFGGVGTQGSMIFENSALSLPIDVNPKVINTALNILGVQKKVPFDEFVSLGLGNYRHTDEWSDSKHI